MSEAYTGRGDPRRTMDLLWGRVTPPARGPRSDLTVRMIVQAAIALADTEGLAGLSMRRLAASLGKSAMAIYTHVPGKAELLDLMADTIEGELPTTYDTSGGWRPAAEAMARALAALYDRHPWALQVVGGRRPLGPHHLDSQEACLAVFDGVGLDALGMTRAAAAIRSFVRGVAKDLHDARRAHAVTGMSDDDWWAAHAPLLDGLLDEAWQATHPTIARISDEAVSGRASNAPPAAAGEGEPYLAQVALDTFEFGLTRLLDGLEQHVRAVATSAEAN